MCRLIIGSRDTVGKERELRARSAGKLHLMYLVCVGESGFDQHFPFSGVPAREKGVAEFAVTPHRLG